jgi:hypothetical protein
MLHDLFGRMLERSDALTLVIVAIGIILPLAFNIWILMILRRRSDSDGKKFRGELNSFLKDARDRYSAHVIKSRDSGAPQEYSR